MMYPLVHGVFGSYQEDVFEAGRYKYVAGGNTHAVAIKKDNSVVTWGSGKSTPPVVADAQKIAAGLSHDCVLREDGTVQCWGNNSYGQTSVPASLGQVLDIACCKHTTAALKTDGTVVVWGRNNAGQFNVPSEVDGFAVAIAGHAGSQHFVALLGNGDVYCWGDNSYGQAANQIGYGANAIASGGNFNYLHQSNGALRSWGVNSNGQRNTPNDLLPIIAIACGDSHTMALQNDGTVRCWGYSYYGQTTVPGGLTDVVAIGAAYNQSYAIKSDCTLVGWGDGYNQMLSIPSGLYKIPGSYTPATPPTIPAEPDPTLLAAGIATTANTRGRVFCGLKRAIAIGCNGLFTWGKTDKYQGTTPAGDDYIQVALSERSLSAALQSSGEADVWGEQPYSNFVNSPSVRAPYVPPSPVLDGAQMASISVAGSQYLYFLQSDGAVYAVDAFGDEVVSGDYAAPAGTFTAISSGYAAAAGILSDGTVVAWGSNTDGECDVPVELADVIEVDGGNGFFIALSSDGTVTHWGSAANDVDAIPVFISTPVSIAAGYNHCLAVLTNGDVVGWGDDTYGQATPPASLNNAVRAFGGSDFSIAVMNNGKLTGWGRNEYQQATGHSNRAIVCNDGPPANAVPGAQKLAPTLFGTTVVALNYAGEVIGWDASSYDSTNLLPVPLNLPPASAIATGVNSNRRGYGVIIDGDGKLRTWGSSLSEHSGLLNYESYHPYLKGSSDPDAKAIAICRQLYWGLNVLSDTGAPYVFGGDSNMPPSLPTMIAFETGYSFKIALSAGGVVYAWGNDKKGGLSMPDEAGRVMRDVYNGYSWGLSGVTQISLIGELCAALKSDGSIAVWGSDGGYGALTVPDGLPVISEVQCGYYHVVALDENGAVHCWGDNRSGQCDVPSDLGLVESVFANQSSTYVVLRDGSMRAWGQYAYVPPGLNLND